jgi:hypothetical protein
MSNSANDSLSPVWERLATTAASQALAANPAHDNAAAIRDHVLELARAWEQGELPLRSLRDICTPQERFVTMGMTRPGTPARTLMVRLVDALLAIENELTGEKLHFTTFGTFTDAQLHEDDGVVNGLRIVFPIRYPWLRRPNKETHDPGEPAPPYYARDADERRRIANTDRLPDEAARQLAEAMRKRPTRFGSG